jgi:pimeloyl-ACP methyl ester carboxylesterase
MKHGIWLIAACMFMLWCLPAQAKTSAADTAACSALAHADFLHLTDTRATITTAHFVEAKSDLPAHCAINGVVTPHVGFGMWLPARSAWNHRFFESGCGGFCGIVATSFACTGPLLRGYSCIQTDMGHKSTLVDAGWANHDLSAIIDFAYRSTHVTAVIGKALNRAFYGEDERHSIFFGCSTGGRQGLVEAERFPKDFDGVVSIAPAANETGAGMQLLWSIMADLDKQGHPILAASKLPMLHRAVISQCDMNDGIKDGLIGDPRLCHFDPAKLLCKSGPNSNCLTKAELGVVQKIYAGPHNSAGRSLYTGGLQPGSELNWGKAYLGNGGKAAFYAHMMRQFWRYLAFMSQPPPSWDAIQDFDWDRDPQRVGGMEALYTGENPDLRHFKRDGGKLLLIQGWYDNSVVPLNTIDYYEDLTRFMGGATGTQSFARLFTVPGMEHCMGGDGAWSIDYLRAIDGWATTGTAPDQLLGVHPTQKGAAALRYLGTNLPLPASDVAFSRPLFAYPARAVYSGHGDPTNAENYVAR